MTDTPKLKPRHYTDVQMHLMCVASLLAMLSGFIWFVAMTQGGLAPSETPLIVAGVPMTWGALVLGWVLFAVRKPNLGILVCLPAPILWAAMALGVL